MSQQLFISESYIKENTPLSQNVDIKDILPNIEPAQIMYIEAIVEEQYGETFYEHLLDAYSAQTLSSDEETLVLLIKPALAYRAAEMSLPFIDTQIKNKGLQYQSGDFSAAVEIERMKYLRNELKNRAEAYTSKLVKYMEKYKSLYEANIVSSEISGDKSQSNNSFDSGFVFDNPDTLNDGFYNG